MPRNTKKVAFVARSALLIVLATHGCVSPVDEANNWYPERNPEIEFREVDGEGFLVLPGESRYEVLNEVGFRVFILIDGTKTPEDIASALCTEFEVDCPTALSDLYEYLGELERAGLLLHPIPDRYRERAGLPLGGNF